MQGGRAVNVWLAVLAGCVAVWVSDAQWRYPYNPQWDERYRTDIPCPPGEPWPCWQPPFYPYDPIEREIAGGIGKVVGRSMVYGLDRYINMFLGIPYAKPPIQEYRFKVLAKQLIIAQGELLPSSILYILPF